MQLLESSNLTSSGPVPASKRIVCWDRYAPHSTSLEYLLQSVRCNVWVCQAASGVTSSYDALLDLFECLGNFLTRLEIYTTIPPTPIMTDIIIKIIIELLSVLALATKQIKQGRLSKCAVVYTVTLSPILLREVHEEVVGGERDRSSSPEIGSIDSR